MCLCVSSRGFGLEGKPETLAPGQTITESFCFDQKTSRGHVMTTFELAGNHYMLPNFALNQMLFHNAQLRRRLRDFMCIKKEFEKWLMERQHALG